MIATLWMTPYIHTPIGYWLTPVIGDIVAKQRGEPMTLFLGTLGLAEISDSAVEQTRDTATALGVEGATVLDRDHFFVLSRAATDTLSAAEKEGRLVERTLSSYVCPCGALEIPVEAAEFLKRKTFTLDAGGVHCKRCGNSAHEQFLKKQFLFFRKTSIDFFNMNVNVVPRFYKKEVENLLAQVYKDGVPVSKNRETGATYRNNPIDIEFVLAHTGTLLYENTTLVGTNHVLRQLMLTGLIDIESGTRTLHQLLVLPYLMYPGNKEKWGVAQLQRAGHDYRTLRFMLASSLRWNQKDSELEDAVVRTEYLRLSKLFALTNAARPASRPTLEEITERINHHQCLQGLDQVFKQRGFDYATLHGI